MKRDNPEKSRQGVSKVKLALGAASLFLFIVGIKRTFRSDDLPGGLQVTDEPDTGEEQGRATTGR